MGKENMIINEGRPNSKAPTNAVVNVLQSQLSFGLFAAL